MIFNKVQKASYADLYSLFTPSWFDENGAPRPGNFHPRFLANRFARSCALVRVACQICGEKITGAISSERPLETLKIYMKSISPYGYGDMPLLYCCDDGGRFQSEIEEVMQYHFLDTQTNQWRWVKE